MQVANTLNNTIRILFDPKVETFRLFDLLVVKSADSEYLAQIIEIYDDKFNASQNVAKLKLFYKITENNEVMPYDNFTPSKECEIIKIKPEEVEGFINQDKDTFPFAMNVKNHCPLNLQYDFFNNNAVILSDKIENSNTISLTLAKNLSSAKNTVIIDSTSAINFEDVKTIKAGVDFKLPLNAQTIDYVFEKCLSDATLEFQGFSLAIINEIKRYSKTQENHFIPFNGFVKVLMEQYKATPYAELKVLISRIQKCQTDNVFAKNNKEVKALTDIIENNPLTIIDISGLDSIWQKAYLNHVISVLEIESYLVVRINDEIFDVDTINKIYNKKKNITFVPTVSYNYSKLPTIMQNCQNYILMPSLYQRNDFLDANFGLSNLIAEGCIVFGKNTDNFLYLVKNYELIAEEKKKEYRKIELSINNLSESQKLLNQLSQTSIEETYDENQIQDTLNETLEEVETQENLEEEQLQEKAQDDEIEYNTGNVQENELDDTEESGLNNQQTPQKENVPPFFHEEALEEETRLIFQSEPIRFTNEPSKRVQFQQILNVGNAAQNNQKVQNDAMAVNQKQPQDYLQNSNIQQMEEENAIGLGDEELDFFPIEHAQMRAEEEKEIELSQDEPSFEEVAQEEPSFEEPSAEVQAQDETLKELQEPPLSNNGENEETSKEVQEEIQEEPVKEEIIEVQQEEIEEPVENKEETVSNEVDIETQEEIQEPSLSENNENEDDEENILAQNLEAVENLEDYENEETNENEENKENEEDEIGIAENLQAFDDLEDYVPSSENKAQEEIQEEPQEEIVESQETQEETVDDDNDIDLHQVASDAIDSSFEDILNSSNQEKKPETSYASEPQEISSENENLPIFKEKLEEEPKAKTQEYFEGATVSHGKYGQGTIIKIIQYDQRQLLHIDFKDSGKKLLDPKVADIKIL